MLWHVRKVPKPEVEDAIIKTTRLTKKPPEMPLFNSNLMIVRQAAIDDGFRRPLNMAARAETPVTADKMASVIHRAIKEEPNEIRSQYKKGDP